MRLMVTATATAIPTADQRPTIHIRPAPQGGRYHITVSGPNRAWGVQRLREHLPRHGERCYRESDACWSTGSIHTLLEWLRYDRTVRVDWPEESEDQTA